MGKAQLHVAIIGAGLVGLASSIALSRAGHSVTVLEKSSELSPIGAGISLGPNATRIFREWGLYEKLEEHTVRYHYTKVVSYRDGSQLTIVNDETEVNYGSSEMVIYRPNLLRILVAEAERCGSTIQLGVDVADVHSRSVSGPTVVLANGDSSEWDVVLAADGERSAIRRIATDQEITMRDSGDHALRVTLPMSELLNNQNLKHLVTPPNKTLWIGPGGTAYIYPVQGGELLNVLLTRPHNPADAPPLKPTPVGVDEVLAEVRDWDPELHELLKLSTGYLKWTILQSDIVPKWTNDKHDIAIIGDAAHAMPPYLAQGAAMGFEDAAVIGTLLGLVNSAAEIPEALRIYEELRQPRVAKVRRETQRMRDTYAMDDGPKQRERDEQLRSVRPADGNPFFMQDPVLTKWLYGYNPFEEAKRAWESREVRNGVKA